MLASQNRARSFGTVLGEQVRLTNRGAAHRIPTGAFGQSELKMVVELMEASGDVISRDDWSLFGAAKRGLAPGAPRSFDFFLFVNDNQHPSSVRLLIERIDGDRLVECTLVDRTWNLE